MWEVDCESDVASVEEVVSFTDLQSVLIVSSLHQALLRQTYEILSTILLLNQGDH